MKLAHGYDGVQVTATDGTSAKQFVAGKTYQGIPYSMAGRTYDDTKWAQLVQKGLTTATMTGSYRIDGGLIHEDCLYDFAKEYFADCKEEIEDRAKAHCRYSA